MFEVDLCDTAAETDFCDWKTFLDEDDTKAYPDTAGAAARAMSAENFILIASTLTHLRLFSLSFPRWAPAFCLHRSLGLAHKPALARTACSERHAPKRTAAAWYSE